MANRPGEVRIIGGRWRGSRLPVPAVTGLRPTGDRVRETLFNWLQPVLRGACCLDLFAGTGVLGLEAVSRGAAQAVLVEPDRAAREAILGSVARLDAASSVTLEPAHAARYLDTSTLRFDIVFIDPPFAEPAHLEVLDALPRLLAPDAQVYLEQAATAPMPVVPAHWSMRRERRFGDVRVQLFLVADASDGETGII